MSIFAKLWDGLTGTKRVEVRARDDKGQFVADDKATKNVNESRTMKRVKKERLAKDV
tara:strand:+ start:145 stop:315 length:171 start_codon:yes stop_codon:yes gene_type:complete